MKKKVLAMYDYLKDIFVKFEGFSSVPYWDVKQWSWGYGTKVPGSSNDKTKKPSGTISRAKGMLDSFVHVEADKDRLRKALKVELNQKQMAALLSFSYNLGVGNALKMVDYINAGDLEFIGYKWRAYNKVQNDVGVLIASKHHTERRAYEWNLYNS